MQSVQFDRTADRLCVMLLPKNLDHHNGQNGHSAKQSEQYDVFVFHVNGAKLRHGSHPLTIDFNLNM